MNRYQVYCGPTLVNQLAALLNEHTDAYLQGTEHLYVQTYYTVEELVKLLNTVSSGFTLRDVRLLSNTAHA